MRRVVVTGVGLISPVGIGTEETWQALCEGRGGIGPITLVRPDRLFVPHRRRGQEFRSPQLRHSERHQEDGAIHLLRARGDRGRRRAGAVESNARRRRPHWRLHRQRHRGIRRHRAGAPRAAGRRPAADLAVFHSRQHHQSGFGPCFDPAGGQRAEFRHGHRLHHRRARGRGFLPHHRARRRRCDDLRRRGGCHHAHGGGRLCRHAGAVDPQRRPGARQPPLGRATATGLWSARALAC